jgi:hypothetical protein
MRQERVRGATAATRAGRAVRSTLPARRCRTAPPTNLFAELSPAALGADGAHQHAENSVPRDLPSAEVAGRHSPDVKASRAGLARSAGDGDDRRHRRRIGGDPVEGVAGEWARRAEMRRRRTRRRRPARATLRPLPALLPLSPGAGGRSTGGFSLPLASHASRSPRRTNSRSEEVLVEEHLREPSESRSAPDAADPKSLIDAVFDRRVSMVASLAPAICP